MRPFITAFSIFIWLLLGWFLFQSNKECCKSSVTTSLTGEETRDQSSISAGDTTTSASETTSPPASPLVFNWSASEPVINPEWEEWKQNMLAAMTPGQMLEITGLYAPGESNTSQYDNLGEARANEIVKLLSPQLESTQIQLQSKSAAVAETGKAYAAWETRIFTKTVTIDESIVDKVVIRFPFNSARRIADPEIERYLDQMAQKVIRSGESLRITGHSDNIGPRDANMSVGLERANAVKDHLIRKGVEPGKILTLSKGQSEPVGSNATREGRALNRRTEVEIIK